MTLFFDRSMGKTIGRLLKGCGIDAYCQDDDGHFEQNEYDEDLLRAAGKRGHVFITVDESIAKMPARRQLMANCRVRCIVLRGAASRDWWWKVRMIAKHWDHIEKAAAEPSGVLCLLTMRACRREQLPKPRR